MRDLKNEHTVEKVYIREKTGLDIAIIGTATFYLKTETITIDFAAQMVLVDEKGLKIKSYTVYAVCGLDIELTFQRTILPL
jgi:hypothetical protein